MQKIMTSKQLTVALGIERKTLLRWINEGCPVAGKNMTGKTGRPSYQFDITAVKEWADLTGKKVKGIDGAIIQEAIATPPATDAADLVNQPGLIGALERTRQREKLLNQMLKRRTKENAPKGEIATINRILTSVATELRLMETAALEYQRKTGELCDFAEVKRLFSQIASGTRERIMALPNELAPVLREYLRDPDDAGKVRDEIDQAIRHALAALPDEYPDPAVAS